MSNIQLRIRNLLTWSLIAGGLFFTWQVLAATFTDDTQAEFDAGTYSNTQWSTNHVQLTSGQTSGTFTSQVFDGGTASTSWDQISWSETLPVQNKFLAVDVSNAAIWKSINGASTFSSINSDYNGGVANGGIDDLVVTSAKVLYILHNTAVWQSNDFGATWSQLTSAYGGTAGLFMTVESDDDLYIVDGGENIWRSTNGGSIWTQVATNMNGGSGSAFGLTAVGSTLYIVDAAADVWTSTNNGTTWTAVNLDYNGAVADGATDYLTANASGHLFIARNAEVYRSTDGGVSWTQMTVGYGDVDIQVMDGDSSGYLYLVNLQEEIYRSTNNGTSWTQVSAGDINGANGDIEGFVIFPIAVDLTFSARSGNTNPPTDSFSGSLTDPVGGAPGVLNARYFQYRASFSSEDGGVTPELSSVTVTYTVNGPPPPPPTPTPTTQSNNNPGTITVTKKVINDNGGTNTVSDFPLFVSGRPVVSGVTEIFSHNLPYDVTETSNSNYTRTFSGDCDANGRVYLLQGDNKFCIVTNDDNAPPFAYSNIDYNNDRKINISDWSIFLSNWSSSDETVRARDDLNKDGNLNVFDFSVFLALFQLGSKL